MKTAMKVLVGIALLGCFQARAEEDRMVANLDLDIKKEFVRVTPGDVETISGIVTNSSDEMELGGGIEETEAE